MKSLFRSVSHLLCIFFLFISFHCSAQVSSDQFWQIVTRNGNEYVGQIMEQNAKEVKLKTADLGTITIPMKDVKSMKEVKKDQIRDGEAWAENILASRYFITSSGYNLKKGEGYYQNSWVFFNQFSYGLSDNFNIGLGFVPTFLFGGGATPVWVTPKLSIPIAKEQFNLGAGALIGTVLGSDFDSPVFYGFTYGAATVGTSDKNVSVGLGYGFADGSWANSPLITISGMYRVGKKFYLVSENYFGGFGFGILSVGGRSIWKSIALDYGLFAPVGNNIDVFGAAPWLSVTVPFGR